MPKDGKENTNMEPRNIMLVYNIFERWGVDAIGPLPRTAQGKCYMLTTVDYMSKWMEVKVVKRVDSKRVADCVYEHMLQVWDSPGVVVR